MRPESRSRIEDAIRAAEAVGAFVDGKTETDFLTDLLLQSAVERQLTIIGEALAALRRGDPDVAALIPHLAAAVGFRNVLVHGYEAIDDEVTWLTAVRDLPELIECLLQLQDR